MRFAFDNRDLAEIFVQCDKNSTFIVGFSQNFFISWIFGLIACPNNVMAGRLKSFFRSSPDTGI
jgi:hypothetical protein